MFLLVGVFVSKMIPLYLIYEIRKMLLKQKYSCKIKIYNSLFFVKYSIDAVKNIFYKHLYCVFNY